MIDLSPLLDRVLEHVPDENKGDVVRDFDKFQYEIDRMSPAEEKVGQASLTREEIQKLKTTNQNSDDGLTVIQLQAIKGKALANGVSDWTSKIDETLSYRENMQLMER